MPRAEQSIVVNTAPDVLYGVIVDYQRYTDFLPDVNTVKILSRREGGCDVEYSIRVIKKVDYTLRMTEVPNQSVSWTMVKSNLLKSNVGGWRLEDLGNGSTRATYGLEIGVGRLVPQRILDKLAGSQLPATLEAFKKRAEGMV